MLKDGVHGLDSAISACDLAQPHVCQSTYASHAKNEYFTKSVTEMQKGASPNGEAP